MCRTNDLFFADLLFRTQSLVGCESKTAQFIYKSQQKIVDDVKQLKFTRSLILHVRLVNERLNICINIIYLYIKLWTIMYMTENTWLTTLKELLHDLVFFIYKINVFTYDFELFNAFWFFFCPNEDQYIEQYWVYFIDMRHNSSLKRNENFKLSVQSTHKTV